MRIPFELEQAIETLAEPHKLKSLIKSREEVSSDYRKGADSKRAFQDEEQLLSYLITRFPATFAVCCKVFEEILARLPSFPIHSILDLGSGPGSASWAAAQVIPELTTLHMVEREVDAIEMGKRLAHLGVAPLAQASWTRGSLETEFLIPKADVAILSYVLGEMSLEQSQKIVDRLWASPIPLLVLIEPGTPRGYERILALRDEAIRKGAQIVAPCPHRLACPMKEGEWCHFGARVERTSLHRRLKDGTLGYEDEKYSYVVLAKPNLPITPIFGRLVHRPFKGSGHVKLPLCVNDGTLKEVTVTRKDKGPYKAARDSEWGSAWM
jgi:ribosomal protein RSM22 (predicted rRNA methylase)